MSAKDLRDLLEHLDDTREIVLREAFESELVLPWPVDELHMTWRDAEEEAICAYVAWRQDPGASSYAVYRAAADRSEAAQEALTASACEAGIAA